MHDPKAHSKGGTLENTINGRADEEVAPAPQHLIHPGKDISKLYGTTKYSLSLKLSAYNRDFPFVLLLRDIKKALKRNEVKISDSLGYLFLNF